MNWRKERKVQGCSNYVGGGTENGPVYLDLDRFEIVFLRFFFLSMVGGGEYRLLTQIHVHTRLATVNSVLSSDSLNPSDARTKGDIPKS